MFFSLFHASIFDFDCLLTMFLVLIFMYYDDEDGKARRRWIRGKSNEDVARRIEKMEKARKPWLWKLKVRPRKLHRIALGLRIL